MTSDSTRQTDEMLLRIQGEFLEMPGLQLTLAQASRLWGCESGTCAALLATLVDIDFLFRTRHGAFMRVERLPPMRAHSQTAGGGRPPA